MTGSLTAVLLPLTMAAPALATDDVVDTTGALSGTTVATAVADTTTAAATVAVATTATAVTAVAPAATSDAAAAVVSPAAAASTTSFRVAPAALAAPAAAPVVAAPAGTAMRLSAAQIGADGTARIGVRLLSGSATLAGQAVTVQSRTATGWVDVRQLRTDGQGLAVGQLPFPGRTEVRAVFAGTATHASSVSPTGTVQAKAAVQARPAPGSVGQLAVQIASQQSGKPYRYGSTGPGAFDCSGFTSFVYNKVGKKLPRTSAAQAAALPKVAQAAKQPGDLLFFRTRGRVSHVGIYAGGGKMWAAPTRGDRVKLQSIYSASYSVGRVV